MYIRLFIARVISKPFLIPLGFVTSAFWYGNYKITSNILHSLIGLETEKYNKYQNMKGNIITVLVGGAVFYIRGFENITTKPDISLNSNSRISNILNNAKKLIPGKYFITSIIISSTTSATSAFMVKKYF